MFTNHWRSREGSGSEENPKKRVQNRESRRAPSPCRTQGQRPYACQGSRFICQVFVHRNYPQWDRPNNPLSPPTNNVSRLLVTDVVFLKTQLSPYKIKITWIWLLTVFPSEGFVLSPTTPTVPRSDVSRFIGPQRFEPRHICLQVSLTTSGPVSILKCCTRPHGRRIVRQETLLL